MALLISHNVYQPSSHYPTSLIMQDPCLHQCSFEQSLTKRPCECLMYNLTPRPSPQHTLLSVCSQFGPPQTSDLGRSPLIRGSSVRPLVLLLLLGLPAHPVWPPRYQAQRSASGSHSRGGNSRQNLPTTFFSQRTLPVCSSNMGAV